MTREEAIKILKEIIDEGWLISDMEKCTAIDACEMAIKALEQEPTTKNDLALINTEGLDEGIRCAMCTNSMANDRGCDGSCVVNNGMYKAVMDAIGKRIQPTTKNALGVDCILRQQAIDAFPDLLPNMGYNKKAITEILQELPSVTPQEPRKGHWVKTPKAVMGEGYMWYCDRCEHQVYQDSSRDYPSENYCPNCGADMRGKE